MAEKITVYQCPACTGPLHYDGKIGKLQCDYCGSTYSTEEIEALYKKQNESAVKSDQEAQKKAAAAGEKAAAEAAAAGMSAEAAANGGWGSDAAHMRAYNCTSCGAELICDDTTAATSCPYCGNPTVIPSKFAGVDRPDYLIPFKVDKQQAIQAFKEYYKGRKLLPRSFASDNHIEEIKGVYVPFWMFSGKVDGAADYEARKEERRRAGDEEIVRTEFFDVHREGSMHFDKIPVDASTKMPDDLMDSIEPFDYKEMRPFGMEYMPGYLANKYDVSKEESRGRATERATNTFRSALQNTVKGYNSVSVRNHHEKTKLQLAGADLSVRHERTERQDDRRLTGVKTQTGGLGDRRICGCVRDPSLPDTQAAGRQYADQRRGGLHRGGDHRGRDEQQYETGRKEPLGGRLCRR